MNKLNHFTRARMEDGGVTEKTNEPTPRKEGLLPPGPCSQCSYCDPSGWGKEEREPFCQPRESPGPSPEVVLRALARESRGWESRRVPLSSGTAGLGHVLQREEFGTWARRMGRGALTRDPGAECRVSGERRYRQLPRMLITARP